MRTPVAVLQRQMGSREFEEWRVEYELDPWSEERGDLRAGIVASMLAAKAEPKQFVMTRKIEGKSDKKKRLKQLFAGFGVQL